MIKKQTRTQATAWGLLLGGTCVILAGPAHSAMVVDKNGNVGYTTMQECEAAVQAGTAKFYQPFTEHPPLRRAGEATVRSMRLGEVVIPENQSRALGFATNSYANGACDLGVGRSNGRDGVSERLIGTYVPFSTEMSVNVYFDQNNEPLRVTMQQCDNNFSRNFPRPIAARTVAAATECFAQVVIPARFETRTEQVVRVAASQRVEVIPATYKTMPEQVLVSPEYSRAIAVPPTFKNVSEVVEVKPASFIEEPVPATYKTESETIEVKPASTRLEVVPATFKTVTEQILVSPERKELVVVPAVYGEREETVVDRPASTRVVTQAETYETVTEQVLLRPEAVRYEPINIPLRKVTDRVLRAEASSRLQSEQSSLKTVAEQVLVREASTRLVEVPAVFETVTERIKVADASKEWKRGSAWLGRALEVRPLRNFIVDNNGTVDGNRVNAEDLRRLNRVDDDIMCLVEIPEQFTTITRQVLKTPATTRQITVPAGYTTVNTQVLDRQASASQVAIPATYQTVTREVIDVERLRTMGYRFDDKGDIVATPTGERVLRAAAVMAGQGTVAATAGAASGSEGYVREIRTPATYQTVSRQVIAQPASVRTVEVPATFKSVKTQVVTTPASTREVVVPAVFKTVTREVVDAPAGTREFAIPAEFRTVERKVVVTPAATRKIPVPAVTQTITRRVIDTPASVRQELVPAVFKTETRQVIDRPAATRVIEVPAQFETLTQQVLVEQAKTETRSVLCDVNTTPAKVREIQRALRAAGFNPGPIDGVIRNQTMQAVNQYQAANNLPVDLYLNLDTVKALGVSPN